MKNTVSTVLNAACEREDIRRRVRAWHLKPADAYFREIILRYGGEEAMNRILSFWNET